ncbi:protein borderless [Leptidea sinapis]|uniref:protein borderless n=1 Tax=Leptidea sinapis TaxID=189913 RepID=UPI00213385C9|nr:protein borderless [Leptidea sinapis]
MSARTRVVPPLWVRVLLLMLPARGSLLPLDVERLRASVGGYAVMNCHLDFPFGNEIPYHLAWDKDGETIFSWYSGNGAPVVADRWGGRVWRVEAPGGPGGGGRAALGGGSLNVTSVRETDAGLYRCLVTFPNRTPPSRNNGTFYYLDVDGGNLIMSPPLNRTVVEGEHAELECLPRSPEWNVQWVREGGSQPAGQRAANGSLVLQAATSADRGWYECHVSAEDGQRQSASAFLDVHYKAKVVYSPKERHLPLGKPASLDCHFSANPPLTNLRWEKDGFLFDPYNVPGVFYSRNGSLLFNKVDESHEGVYSCTAYNALGSGGASGGVRVRVLRPPELALRPAPLYLARLGATLALPCQPAPTADPLAPPPVVSWTRKDGRPLPEGRHSLEDGNLTLVDIAEEDRGVYECTASNEAAAARALTELMIENVPPRAPYNLTARPGVSDIHLTWLPGHGGAEMEYTVWYRRRADREWRTMRLLTRGVTDATLLQLRPGAEYELRVLAQDRLGDGLFSQPIFVNTLGAEMEEIESVGVAAAVTEGGGGIDGSGDEDATQELDVSVRLLEEGALVRWSGVRPGERCEVRWYGEGEVEGERLLASMHTSHDYMLLGASIAPELEGGAYRARVRCGSAAGHAALHVPQYARLRTVAVGVAAGALLLAALAAALLVWRRRSARSSRDSRTARLHKRPR